MSERDDTWYRCAVEIVEYIDLDGYETSVAAIIERYFPAHVEPQGNTKPAAKAEESEASL